MLYFNLLWKKIVIIKINILIFLYIDRTKIIKRLLQKGANKHLKDNRGRTPYDLAMEKNKFHIADMLKDKNLCQMCMVKMPLEKVEKNKTNIIFFFSIHLVVEPFIIGVSAPCK